LRGCAKPQESINNPTKAKTRTHMVAECTRFAALSGAILHTKIGAPLHREQGCDSAHKNVPSLY
jgi:hypothetical protein